MTDYHNIRIWPETLRNLDRLRKLIAKERGVPVSKVTRVEAVHLAVGEALAKGKR